MIIYGSMLCKDCVQCRQELDAAGVSYEFRDFADNLQYLKDFMKIRDAEVVFNAVRDAGGIGIPCLVESDGSVVLSWKKYL